MHIKIEGEAIPEALANALEAARKRIADDTGLTVSFWTALAARFEAEMLRVKSPNATPTGGPDGFKRSL